MTNSCLRSSPPPPPLYVGRSVGSVYLLARFKSDISRSPPHSHSSLSSYRHSSIRRPAAFTYTSKASLALPLCCCCYIIHALRNSDQMRTKKLNKLVLRKERKSEHGTSCVPDATIHSAQLSSANVLESMRDTQEQTIAHVIAPLLGK